MIEWKHALDLLYHAEVHYLLMSLLTEVGLLPKLLNEKVLQ